MSDPIRFSRRPYTIQYRDQEGNMQTIRRRPPRKLHEALPTDVVTLNHKKGEDFGEGDEFKVKHINPRHPNILQLENSDGKTTFVPFFDVDLEERVAMGEGVEPRDSRPRNRYLIWP